MTTIFNLFDPSSGEATSSRPGAADDSDRHGDAAAFAGALDSAAQRHPSADKAADDLHVVSARTRMARSGHDAVPDAAEDAAPTAIPIGHVDRGDTQPLVITPAGEVPAAPKSHRGHGTSTQIPAAASTPPRVRGTRQTYSYATRNGVPVFGQRHDTTEIAEIPSPTASRRHAVTHESSSGPGATQTRGARPRRAGTLPGPHGVPKPNAGAVDPSVAAATAGATPTGRVHPSAAPHPIAATSVPATSSIRATSGFGSARAGSSEANGPPRTTTEREPILLRNLANPGRSASRADGAAIPPAPAWRASGAPEPRMERLERDDSADDPSPIVRTETARAIVSGPLRAYAAAMPTPAPHPLAAAAPAMAPAPASPPPHPPALEEDPAGGSLPSDDEAPTRRFRISGGRPAAAGPLTNWGSRSPVRRARGSYTTLPSAPRSPALQLTDEESPAATGPRWSPPTLPPSQTPVTIGEPISAGLDLDPSAFDGLVAGAVPGPSPVYAGPSAPTGPTADHVGFGASDPAPDLDANVGRAGPNRAEISVGAGDSRIGLAITTAGPHVMVEAQVPDQATAHAMRNDMHDLRDALQRHDLQLADMSFSQRGEDGGRPREPSPTWSGHEAADAAPAEDPANTPPNPGGIRVVA